MASVKIVEVIGLSEVSVEDAVQEAVSKVAATIRNIDSVWVEGIKVHTEKGLISEYGVVCKISFRVS